jgi:hypothetical protein
MGSITQRIVTLAVKGITNAGLHLKTVRIDPTNGTIVVDIANGTDDGTNDDIDATLDRRIAEHEKSARPRDAHRAGANGKRKITKDEPS